jgi:ATP adenylyltransferase
MRRQARSNSFIRYSLSHIDRYYSMGEDVRCDASIEESNLGATARRVALRARQSGALRPIETTLHHIEQGGVKFVVRMLGGASGRKAAQQRLQQATIDQPGNANPFLPHDPALFVAELSPTHLCLLNKYPVVEHHLLIVTCTFEAQESLLTAADFDALLRCQREVDGLAFYNSGKIAGASQRHKHLQLAPFPLDPTGVDSPIDQALGSPHHYGEIVRSPHLPFAHALLWLPANRFAEAEEIARSYQSMLKVIGVWTGKRSAPKPYNWLATRRWMLAVPRCAEEVGGIAVNGLGFAGSLLVRDESQLTWLRTVGPLNVLCAVSDCHATLTGETLSPPGAG